MLAGRIIVICIGCILDLCFGDPGWIYHPICMIGNLIHFLTKKMLPLCNKEKHKERMAGVVLVVIVLFLSVTIVTGLLILAYRVHPVLGICLESFWCFQLLAAKSLRQESKKVFDALKVNLSEAQRAVSMIVGRDTESLDEKGVIKAAVETVAENTSDGVVAPLLFITLFGVPGGFFYKAVNTMDSMVGYRNETYQYFGTAAAKLDDICNWVPARLSAVFMIAATGICSVFPWKTKGEKELSVDKNKEQEYYSAKNAWRIWLRDRRKHKSPNSAQTESVCAGGLKLQLAGDASYFGKRYEKPFIGDDIRPIEPEDINRAGRLMYVTSLLAWIFCVLCITLIMLFL